VGADFRDVICIFTIIKASGIKLHKGRSIRESFVRELSQNPISNREWVGTYIDLWGVL
jgi:hypothetical protein